VQGHRYSTPDGRLAILACDLFAVTPTAVGPVEAVWDRTSLVALGVDTRPRYVALMRGLLGQQNFCYLLHGRECELTHGPPHSLNIQQIQQLFGDWAEVEVRSHGGPGALSMVGAAGGGGEGGKGLRVDQEVSGLWKCRVMFSSKCCA
jgi:hypothetical protein